ncbi:MAG: hypothetical protein ACLP70_15985 [Streptosporangiaceae bacterium]
MHQPLLTDGVVVLRAGFRYAGRRQDLYWYTRPVPAGGSARAETAPRWPWPAALRC